MDTIEERIDRAAMRWARATITCLRTDELRQASQWRLDVSRLLLDYPGLARIRGGGEPAPDSTVRDRIRGLIRTGALSRKPPVKMFAGPCAGARLCSACGNDIVKGEVEFEAELPDHRIIILHRHCVDLWLRESQTEIT
jgi:hypothetical protein